MRAQHTLSSYSCRWLDVRVAGLMAHRHSLLRRALTPQPDASPFPAGR